MVQVVDQTKEEQFNMYMKLRKCELVNMLIECHRIIKVIKPSPIFVTPPPLPKQPENAGKIQEGEGEAL